MEMAAYTTRVSLCWSLAPADPLTDDASLAVIFRLVVFKPFIDEIILAKVARSSREGIKSGQLSTMYCLVAYAYLTFTPRHSLAWLLRRLLDTKLSPSSQLRIVSSHCLLTYSTLTHCACSDPARNEFYWVPPQDENDTGTDIEQTPEDERFYIIAGET